MSQLTLEIHFMAGLLIRTECDIEVEVSAETYQVGAHFGARDAFLLISSPCRAVSQFRPLKFKKMTTCGEIKLVELASEVMEP